MPAPDALPEDLRPLTALTPLRLHDTERLPAEASPLLAEIGRILRPLSLPRVRQLTVAAAALMALFVLFKGLFTFPGFGHALLSALHRDAALTCYTPGKSTYPCTQVIMSRVILGALVLSLTLAEALTMPVAFQRARKLWLVHITTLAIFAISAGIFAYITATVYFGWDYSIEGRIHWLERISQPLILSSWSWWIGVVALLFLVRDLYVFARGTRGERFVARSQHEQEKRFAKA